MGVGLAVAEAVLTSKTKEWFLISHRDRVRDCSYSAPPFGLHHLLATLARGGCMPAQEAWRWHELALQTRHIGFFGPRPPDQRDRDLFFEVADGASKIKF